MAMMVIPVFMGMKMGAMIMFVMVWGITALVVHPRIVIMGVMAVGMRMMLMDMTLVVPVFVNMHMGVTLMSVMVIM
jgi:hypothetical protein